MRKLIILSFITPDGVLQAPGGPDIQVHGSGNLTQTLWKYDLADELWLKIFPVSVGSGKRLFADGEFAGGFELSECMISPKGVIITNYKRSGAITSGSFV